MNRENFGKLIKALREESRIRRPDGHKISQEELARQIISMNHDKPYDYNVRKMSNTLARAEQGRKKYFDSTLLDSLATAFELTSRERTQFFLASTGLETDQRSNQHIPPINSILDEIEEILAHTQAPAMVVDFHGDIVMLNHGMLELYGQTKGSYSHMSVLNILLIFFRLPVPNIRKSHYEQRIVQNMRFIRASSLPHRNDIYFSQLLDYAANQHSPTFSRLWQSAYPSQDYFTNAIVHSHHHQKYGNLRYMNTVSTTITQIGNLSMLTYVSLNKETNQIFRDLVRQETVTRIPDWPGYKKRGKELFNIK
jgi:hypothetical protein